MAFVKGANRNVSPTPERAIAVQSANRFLKYLLITTTAAWYTRAEPKPKTKNSRSESLPPSALVPNEILSWTTIIKLGLLDPWTVTGKAPSSPFDSFAFTVDSPGKNPIVTQRNGMLVAQLLSRYPPVISKAPRMEAVFSPRMSEITATRGPWEKREKLVPYQYALAALVFRCVI